MAKYNPTLCLQREDLKVCDAQPNVTITVAFTFFCLYLFYPILHEESSALIFTNAQHCIP